MTTTHLQPFLEVTQPQSTQLRLRTHLQAGDFSTCADKCSAENRARLEACDYRDDKCIRASWDEYNKCTFPCWWS